MPENITDNFLDTIADAMTEPVPTPAPIEELEEKPTGIKAAFTVAKDKVVGFVKDAGSSPTMMTLKDNAKEAAAAEAMCRAANILAAVSNNTLARRLPEGKIRELIVDSPTGKMLTNLLIFGGSSMGLSMAAERLARSNHAKAGTVSSICRKGSVLCMQSATKAIGERLNLDEVEDYIIAKLSDLLGGAERVAEEIAKEVEPAIKDATIAANAVRNNPKNTRAFVGPKNKHGKR